MGQASGLLPPQSRLPRPSADMLAGAEPETAPAEAGANRIVVYERPGFEGLQREFTCDVPDLHELDFGDCISSLRVEGQPWVAYTGPKYEGEAFAFEEGEYAAVEPRGRLSSLRLVHHDLDEPLITLYEHAGFAGRSKAVTEETNLAYGYFDDRVSSHVVQRGVWLLYQDPGRGGRQYIAWPGERLADYRPPVPWPSHALLEMLLLPQGMLWGP
uniref:Beta/gamma crystallin 'Greek key' domain-containing protein n=1 Tax=Crocodylus porosus TaxID=8502 RepID=A0A7M4G1X3_CROPO